MQEPTSLEAFIPAGDPTFIREELIKSCFYVVGASVAGDFAEFGTMTGKTAALLAESLSYYTQKYARNEAAHGIGARTLHLFDSFEGLPEASDPVDVSSPHISTKVIWQKGACRGLSAAQLKTLCLHYLPETQLKIYEGWFNQTLACIPRDRRFALIHIDCDFYESTYQVLDYLLGHRMLSDGCCLLFDDWNCNRASPHFGERKAWADMVAKYSVKYSDAYDYGVFGHKIFYHAD